MPSYIIQISQVKLSLVPDDIPVLPPIRLEISAIGTAEWGRVTDKSGPKHGPTYGGKAPHGKSYYPFPKILDLAKSDLSVYRDPSEFTRRSSYKWRHLDPYFYTLLPEKLNPEPDQTSYDGGKSPDDFRTTKPTVHHHLMPCFLIHPLIRYPQFPSKEGHSQVTDTFPAELSYHRRRHALNVSSLSIVSHKSKQPTADTASPHPTPIQCLASSAGQ